VQGRRVVKEKRKIKGSEGDGGEEKRKEGMDCAQGRANWTTSSVSAVLPEFRKHDTPRRDSRLSRAKGLKRVPRVAFPSRNYGEIPPSVSFPLARAARAHLFKESAGAANPRERKREREREKGGSNAALFSVARLLNVTLRMRDRLQGRFFIHRYGLPSFLRDTSYPSWDLNF